MCPTHRPWRPSRAAAPCVTCIKPLYACFGGRSCLCSCRPPRLRIAWEYKRAQQGLQPLRATDSCTNCLLLFGNTACFLVEARLIFLGKRCACFPLETRLAPSDRNTPPDQLLPPFNRSCTWPLHCIFALHGWQCKLACVAGTADIGAAACRNKYCDTPCWAQAALLGALVPPFVCCKVHCCTGRISRPAARCTPLLGASGMVWGALLWALGMEV